MTVGELAWNPTGDQLSIYYLERRRRFDQVMMLCDTSRKPYRRWAMRNDWGNECSLPDDEFRHPSVAFSRLFTMYLTIRHS